MALEARTEGWIAGLQLAALSMRGRTDVDGFIRAFTGSHRFILDYLMDQVLARESPELQAFMLQTCILERLNAGLCDVVTQQSHSDSFLRELEQRNLFLVALDDEHAWFRYHPLFADVLQHRLRQARSNELAELYRRAAVWFETQGMIAEAVKHSLAGHDFGTAARILEQVGMDITLSGHAQMVFSWFNELPDEIFRSRPMLALVASVAFMISDQLSARGGTSTGFGSRTGCACTAAAQCNPRMGCNLARRICPAHRQSRRMRGSFAGGIGRPARERAGAAAASRPRCACLRTQRRCNHAERATGRRNS